MRRLVTPAVVLVVLACASGAQARDVTLWACHGPAGGALGPPPGSAGGGCDAPGTPLHTSSLKLDVPAKTTLTAVRLDRWAEGPGYVASAAGELERLDDASVLDNVKTFSTGGTAVTLAGGTIDLRSAALTVSDTSLPNGSIGPVPSRVSGDMSVPVSLTDEGLGLKNVSIAVDGADLASHDFGVCAELSPGDATTDLVLGADCPLSGATTFTIHTTNYVDGPHELRVTYRDAAGNSRVFYWDFRTDNGITTIATATPTPTETPTPTPAPNVFAAAAPTPTPTVTPKPRTFTTRDFVTVAKRVKLPHSGKLTLTLRCATTTPCNAPLTLKHAKTKLASARFAAAPGVTKKVALKVSRPKHEETLTLQVGTYAPVTFKMR